MSRIRTLALVGLVAVAIGSIAGSVAASFTGSLTGGDAFAKDDKKDAAKEAKEAAELKAKRDKFRDKLITDGKMPFYDLSYVADPKAAQETRWSQSNPPHPQAEEEKGLQFAASFKVSASQEGGIDIRGHKFIHKSLDGKSEYSYKFDRAGFDCKTADMKKMCEGFFTEWKKEMVDVREEKCVEPKKSSVGPADVFASVIGTNKESQKRERRDFYAWTGPNTSWFLIVTFSDKWLDEPAILVKAEEFVKTIKECKGAPK